MIFFGGSLSLRKLIPSRVIEIKLPELARTSGSLSEAWLESNPSLTLAFRKIFLLDLGIGTFL